MHTFCEIRNVRLSIGIVKDGHTVVKSLIDKKLKECYIIRMQAQTFESFIGISGISKDETIVG